LTEADFFSIKKLILDTASLFWLTGIQGPASRIIDGLARVVRNETPGLRLRTFHADNLTSSHARAAKLVQLAFSSDCGENEYVIRDDIVHVGRVEENHHINRDINAHLPGATKCITKMPLKSRPYDLKLNIRMPGMLDTLCLEMDERAMTELHPEEVEIETKVSSIK
jgi:zearalenone synthase (highly reducing iterative type I polyketide synthase)